MNKVNIIQLDFQKFDFDLQFLKLYSHFFADLMIWR